MARKLKGKNVSSKGLKGALARHKFQDKINEKLKQNAELQKTNQLLKSKSIKTSKKSKQNNQVVKKGFMPLKQNDTVLLIGEGDFSFAKSLILQEYIKVENLIATSYDSYDELLKKYPKTAKENVEFLQTRGVIVKFNVDATNLIETLDLNLNSKQKKLKQQVQLFQQLRPQDEEKERNEDEDENEEDEEENEVRTTLNSNKFKGLNYIMFNFPHTGKGIKDQERNIRDHQNLLVKFFQNCNQLFELVNQKDTINNDFAGYEKEEESETNSNGKIILTVFEGEPYNSWGIKIIAKEQNFKVEQSGKFDWEMFPEYHHKRTNSSQDTTKPANERDARLYVFEKRENFDDGSGKKSKKIKENESDSE
ncbi:uncharacterized protein KGF55_003968 [Candida pseudojiufengensis]|uniref:uncharacterized protein n=1 Tax=Candida pseudojiufengensis TaxID=497109 RepID=UPI002224025B|nr:uncharacterized protein KGF55_003968 [Candida pseudojiufengensis]KAI5961651.1 hypothetical protein KGF55_003968 [Candida pseudojiufengensis]